MTRLSSPFVRMCPGPGLGEPAQPAEQVPAAISSSFGASCCPPNAFFSVGYPDLFQLVEQRLVADLELLRGALAVPASSLQGLQNQLSFCLARRGPSGNLQRRNLYGFRRGDGTSSWAQIRKRQVRASKGHDLLGRIFQLANVSRPSV